MPQQTLSAIQIERVNRSDIAALVGDDNVEAVLIEFIAVLRHAVPIWQTNLSQRDWHQLRLLAHCLKSSAGFVGLHKLAADLNQFEQAISIQNNTFEPSFDGQKLLHLMQCQLTQLLDESSRLKHQRK